MRFKFLLCVAGAVLLSGCVSEQALVSIGQKSDRALCMDWMTKPDLNIYNSAREAEIRRRKLDCWAYGNVAEEKSKANAGVQKSLDKIAEAVK